MAALAADAGPAQGARVSVGDGAGGTYVTWADTRDGLTDIYLLRVTNTGAVAAGWPATGLAVCTATGNQVEPRLIPDGSNGVIVTWWDQRNGFQPVEGWAQRVSAAGAMQWTTNGVKYIDDQTLAPVLSADGTGGLLAAWTDGSAPNVYATRLNSSGVVPAGWSASGTEVCSLPNGQSYPAITHDGAGGAFVAWQDLRNGLHVFAQHLNASGAAQWTSDGIQMDAAVFALQPTVTSDGAGGAILTWADFEIAIGEALRGQRIDGAGAPQWGGGVTLATPASAASNFRAVADGLGGAIVWWAQAAGGNTLDEVAQRVDAGGTAHWGAGGVTVLPLPVFGTLQPELAPDGAGGGFVSWIPYTPGLLSDIRAQHISSTGTMQWTASGLVVRSNVFSLTAPQIATDGSGGLTIGWIEQGFAPYVTVGAQRYDAAGAPQLGAGAVVFNDNGSQIGAPVLPDGAGGGWVLWDQGPAGSIDIAARHVLSTGVSAGPTLAVAGGAGDQSMVAALPDGAGGAIAVWQNRGNGTFDLYAQRISAAGAPLWGASGVAVCTAAGIQNFTGAVSDGSGGVIVGWTDKRDAASRGDVYAQRVSSAGAAMWGTDGVAAVADTNQQSLEGVAATPGGGAILLWSDARDTSGVRLYGQRLDGAGSPQWAANGVILAPEGNTVGSTADGVGGVIFVTSRQVLAAASARVDSTEYLAYRFDGSGSPLWGSALVAYDQPTYALLPQVISDGAGGAELVWVDGRAGAGDIYLQHITSAGTASFGLGGTPVCTAPGWQVPSSMFVSGSGDLTVTWSDERSGYADAYVQRIASDGSAVWAPNGVPLCTAARGQYSIGSAPDGALGGIFAWTDYRSGTERLIYMQRLNPSGVPQWTGGGVVPVLVSLASASATQERVALQWLIAGTNEASVERTENGSAWTTLATIAADGSDHLVYEDRAVTPGARYGYRLRLVIGGVESRGGDVWVEVPTAPAFRLAGVTPNPARGRTWRVSFALATGERARLEVLDLAGRVVAARELTGFEPGNHELVFDRAPATPGVYFLRLTQGGRSLTARVVALRE